MRPESTLHIRILDEECNELLRSVRYGYGEPAFLFANGSPENLSKLLNDAVEQLEGMEREDL